MATGATGDCAPSPLQGKGRRPSSIYPVIAKHRPLFLPMEIAEIYTTLPCERTMSDD